MALAASTLEAKLLPLLEKCRSTTSLPNARRLHALLLTSGHPLSPFASNHVLSMYAKCGSLSSARKVFDGMSHRNIISYNTLISAYSRHPDLAPSAFTLLAHMRRDFFWPNAGSFNGLLQGASALQDLFTGLALHSQVLKSGFFADAYVFTSLIGFYSNCGELDSAVKLFDCMSAKDAVTWNCIISGCLKNDRVKDGLSLFHKMVARSVIPTEFTYSMVLKACGKLENYACGQLIHGRIVVGNVLVDLPLENALVDMYSSCGDITSAFNIFSRIDSPDLVSLNSMILACSEVEDGEKAMQLFTRMLGMDNINPDEYTFAAVISSVADGEPLHSLAIISGCETSAFVGTALVSMYCAKGRINCAKQVFEGVLCKDVVLWTELCSGYSKSGDSENSLKLFQCMRQEGHKLDCFIVSTALNACADLASLTQGEMIHCLCIKSGCCTEISVCGSLIDMYSKNGSLGTAEMIFYGLNDPDLKCLNSMIGCFGQHGKAEKALEILEEIISRGFKPDEVTFVSLLSVCAHSGLVETGRVLWRYMKDESGIVPGAKHYSCMVSLLSKAGLFEEAMEMVEESACGELWRTVLASSVGRGEVEVGVYAAERVEEDDVAMRVLVSNLYAGVGRWDRVVEMRRRMKGVKEQPGLSWIQIRNEFVVFAAGDQSHPLADEIHMEDLAKAIGLTGQSSGFGRLYKKNWPAGSKQLKEIVLVSPVPKRSLTIDLLKPSRLLLHHFIITNITPHEYDREKVTIANCCIMAAVLSNQVVNTAQIMMSHLVLCRAATSGPLPFPHVICKMLKADALYDNALKEYACSTFLTSDAILAILLYKPGEAHPSSSRSDHSPRPPAAVGSSDASGIVAALEAHHGRVECRLTEMCESIEKFATLVQTGMDRIIQLMIEADDRR